MMLVGNLGKFLGTLFGLLLAAFLITQQNAIFDGLMSRTYGAISDCGYADIWVMDPKVQFIDDLKPLPDTALQRVRGVDGVAWAVPLYKGMLKARLDNGTFQTCNVFGLDDATLVGGPPVMVQGSLADLRRADGVIVDEVGANGKLARPSAIPGGKPVPIAVGDVLELNDHRATVVGICQVSRTFQSQPVLYTTFNRAMAYAPRERRMLTFTLVQAAPGVDHRDLCARITASTGFAARTRDDFRTLTYDYFMKYTGIPINFRIAVGLAFIVGAVISGLMFYSFTMDNLKHFGALKAMGATNGLLLRMVLLQAGFVAAVGYGLGVALAAAFGMATAGTELAFKLVWQTPALTALAIAAMTTVAAVASSIRVMTVEPAIVFKS